MIRLKEIVPFNKTDAVEKGLSKKYRDLAAGTFGLDIEFHTASSDDDFDPSDYIDEFVREVSRSHSSMDEYYDWLNDQREWDNRRYRGDNWDDSHGPEDEDNWLKYHPDPERSDYSEGPDGDSLFDQARDEWLDDRRRIERSYSSWESRDREDYVHEWFSEKISDGTWSDYVEAPIVDRRVDDQAIVDTDDYIESLTGQPGSKSGWEVGEDGADIMEIRTPPMTYTPENLSLLSKVMSYCYKNYEAAGDTSAHVHIGMEKDSTIFDLLAATTLVDEKAIQKDISADRELEQFAALADAIHNKIIDAIDNFLHQREMEISQMIGKSFTVPNEQLKTYIKNAVSRYSGTNIQSFFRHQTLEFRYFSSQIAPHMGKFEQWIKYFMLIAKIARSRNQFTIGKTKPYPLAFTREGKGMTKITILDEKGKMPKATGMPSDHLRSQPPDPGAEEKKIQAMLKKKAHEPNQPELQFSKLP